jgi:hypothetical protein
MALLMMGRNVSVLERDALRETGSTTVMLALLIVAWMCVRRAATALGKREEQELRFEEEEPPEVMGLGLYRDGVMAIETPETKNRPADAASS